MLLDTHTLLWFLNDDPRLPVAIKDQIEMSEVVCISIASLWEIVIKVQIGKLEIQYPFPELQAIFPQLGIEILPLTMSDLEEYLRLPLHHRDPFDRMLVAQAITHHLTLVSLDQQLDVYPIQRLW